MITLDGLELPEELIWVDEMSWSEIKATTKRTIQGKFIVQENKVPSQAGRNITLTSDDAWIDRTDLLQLQDWSNELGKELFLVLNDGSSYLCRFRHWDDNVLSNEQISPTAFQDGLTQYKLTIKLAVV